MGADVSELDSTEIDCSQSLDGNETAMVHKRSLMTVVGEWDRSC